MIWLAERIAALVVIIIGSQILLILYGGSRSKWAHGTYSARWLCSRFVDRDRMDALAPGLAKTAHGPIVSFANLTMKTLLLTLVALYQKPIAARQKASVEGQEARLTGKVLTMAGKGERVKSSICLR